MTSENFITPNTSCKNWSEMAPPNHKNIRLPVSMIYAPWRSILPDDSCNIGGCAITASPLDKAFWNTKQFIFQFIHRFSNYWNSRTFLAENILKNLLWIYEAFRHLTVKRKYVVLSHRNVHLEIKCSTENILKHKNCTIKCDSIRSFKTISNLVFPPSKITIIRREFKIN